VLLNYRGKAGYFNTVSLRDILEDKVPKDWGRDRIILIGAVGESFKDLFYTPYSGDLLSIPEPMPGVEIQAHLTSQIISAAMEGRPLIKSWSETQECLWIIFWAFVGATFTWQWRYLYLDKSLTSIIVRATLVLIAGVLLGSTYIAVIWGWWLPAVPPFLAFTGSVIAITAYIANTADSIRKTFGRYLTDEVVATLLESPEGLKIGGKRQRITVVTSDLRGFTALSEKLDPEVVVTILNIYLESMLDAIAQYQGTIDKFMGDGIVILFGAPTMRLDDPQRAVACAVSMQLAMTTVNKKLQQLNLPTLSMGIGINTGEVVVGNIGSEKHTEYTVIGKEMNLAFRIEGYSTGKQILISEPTLTAIGTSTIRIHGEFKIKPKGITELITVYDIGGIGEPYNLFLPKELDIYFPLIEPISITYQILEGKQVCEPIFKGSLIKLSEKGAEVQIELGNADTLPSPLSNIKLNLLMTNNQNQYSEDIYAKVLDKPATPGNFYLQFTFKPPAEAGIIFKALSQSIRGNT
jgi:adenylate cyclase